MVTKWEKLTETEDIVRFMGDYDVISTIFSTFKQMRTLQESNKRYESLVDTAQKPILFVEGVSDKIIMEAAAQNYFKKSSVNKLPIIIYACNGTSQMGSLKEKGIARLAGFLSGKDNGKMLFVLTDNDRAGRETGKNPGAVNDSRWNSSERFVYWRRLPFSDEMKKKFEDLSVPKEYWPGVIENCFSIEFRKAATGKNKYKFETKFFPDIQEYSAKQFVNEEAVDRWVSVLKDEDMAFYLRDPAPEYKEVFAQYVAEQSRVNPKILEWTNPIFEQMLETIDREKKLASKQNVLM